MTANREAKKVQVAGLASAFCGFFLGGMAARAGLGFDSGGARTPPEELAFSKSCPHRIGDGTWLVVQ